MALTFPRTPGLLVRAIRDTSVYSEGDIALITNRPQPGIADHIYLVWPKSHPNYRANSLSITNIFDGRNFEALSQSHKPINTQHLLELVTYTNAQTPILLVLFAENIRSPGLSTHINSAPAPTPTPPPPPSLHFYRVDTARTLTNDYLRKEKDEN